MGTGQGLCPFPRRSHPPHPRSLPSPCRSHTRPSPDYLSPSAPGGAPIQSQVRGPGHLPGERGGGRPHEGSRLMPQRARKCSQWAARAGPANLTGPQGICSRFGSCFPCLHNEGTGLTVQGSPCCNPSGLQVGLRTRLFIFGGALGWPSAGCSWVIGGFSQDLLLLGAVLG